MTKDLIPAFDSAVVAWLDHSGPNQFELGGVDFQLSYDGCYHVLCEGVEVAWTDNHKDFRKVGHFLLNNDDTTLVWEAA